MAFPGITTAMLASLAPAARDGLDHQIVEPVLNPSCGGWPTPDRVRYFQHGAPMQLRPRRWVFVLAVACAVGSLAVVAWAPGIARLLAASRLPVFPGLKGGAYYEARLRETALIWALVLPALVITAGSIRRQWKALATREAVTGLGCSRGVALWLLVVLVLGLSVPRVRTGDEPSYLAMAVSVADRGSLVLDEGRADVHFSAASAETRSVHSPGISVLLAAPIALLGNPGVPLVLAAIGLGFLLCVREMLAMTVGPDLSTLLAMVLVASFPVVTYAPLVLPEMAGALGLAVLHWRLVLRGRAGPASGVALAVLPWLHVRFIAPALIYAGYGLFQQKNRRLRASLWLVAPLAASFAVMGWLHQRWFGSPSPVAMWGGRTDLISHHNPIVGALGLLVDQQYGLLVWAPIFVLAPLGLERLWRRSRAQASLLGAVVIATVGPGILHQWWGGWSPAARFLVPVTGQLVLLAALGLARVVRGGPGDRALAGALIACQLAIGAACALVPGKVFGTFEAEPRNYYLDLVGRALGCDPTHLIPSLRVSQSGWTVMAAACLVAAWLGGSFLWSRRLARLAGAVGDHATTGAAPTDARG
jgi:hypothetical protein